MNSKIPSKGIAMYDMEDSEWVMLNKKAYDNFSKPKETLWGLMGYDDNSKKTVVAQINHVINVVLKDLYQEFPDKATWRNNFNHGRVRNDEQKIRDLIRDPEQITIVTQSFIQQGLDINRGGFDIEKDSIHFINKMIKLSVLCQFLLNQYKYSYVQGDQIFFKQILKLVIHEEVEEEQQIALAYLIVKKIFYDLHFRKIFQIIDKGRSDSGVNELNYPLTSFTNFVFIYSLIKHSKCSQIKKIYKNQLPDILNMINSAATTMLLMDGGYIFNNINIKSLSFIIKKTLRSNNIIYFISAFASFFCEYLTKKRIDSTVRKRTELEDMLFLGPDRLDIPSFFNLHGTTAFKPKLYQLPFPKKRAQRIFNNLTKNDNELLLKMSNIIRSAPWPNEGTLDINQIINDPVFKLSLRGGRKRRKSVKKRRFKLNKTIKLKH